MRLDLNQTVHVFSVHKRKYEASHSCKRYILEKSSKDSKLLFCSIDGFQLTNFSKFFFNTKLLQIMYF